MARARGARAISNRHGAGIRRARVAGQAALNLETSARLEKCQVLVTTFPKGEHDDQVDSTGRFLDWLKRPFSGQGIYEYYRQLAQEAERRRKPRPVQTEWAKSQIPTGEIAEGLIAAGSDQSLVVLVSQNPRAAEVVNLKRRAGPPCR